MLHGHNKTIRRITIKRYKGMDRLTGCSFDQLHDEDKELNARISNWFVAGAINSGPSIFGVNQIRRDKRACTICVGEAGSKNGDFLDIRSRKDSKIKLSVEIMLTTLLFVEN